MKAFAEFRMTMILERQDALRREAARERLATHPTDGFITDAGYEPAVEGVSAPLVDTSVSVPESEWPASPTAMRPVSAMAVSGGNAKAGSDDCGQSHGAAAA